MSVRRVGIDVDAGAVTAGGDNERKDNPLVVRASDAIAVVWKDPKRAALYFDRILPIGDFDSVPEPFRFDYELIRDKYVWLPTEYYVPDSTAWEALVDGIRSPVHYLPDEINTNNDWVISVSLALRRMGCRPIPILAERDWRFELLEEWYHEPPTGWDIDQCEPGWPSTRECLAAIRDPLGQGSGTDYLEVVYDGLPGPETESVTWDRIVDFRNDARSVELLRGFHLVLEERARGKDRGHVERLTADWLASLNRGAREHRFSLMASTTRAVLNAKSLLGGMLLGSAGLVTHSPSTVTVGAAVAGLGEAIEIGLAVAQERRSRANWLHGAELGYIQHVDDQLGS